MSYYNSTPSYNGWGDVDSREAHSTYSYTPESDTDYYDGLEMRTSSRNTSTPSTFGLGTRKARRSPPRAPFKQSEGPESTTSSSGYGYTPPLTSSSSSSSSSSERHCCHSTSRHDELLRTPPKPKSRYDEPIEPLNPLSPRPSTQKRNSIGSSRPSLKGNTRTSFTANGDRVEEYSGEGSLRIGTHWADDDEVSGSHIEGLSPRGARRNSGYGRGDVW